jgi:heavy metal sensor kinase
VRLPIRTRLTLLFGVLVFLVLVGAGFLINVRFNQDLRRTVDQGLTSRAQALFAGIDENEIQFPDESNLIDPDESFAQVLGPAGQLLETSSPSLKQPLLPVTVAARLTRSTYFDLKVKTTDESFDARILAVPSHGAIVVVGASLEQQQDAAERLLVALLVGGASALVVTTLIGWAVAGTALRPVERMRVEAAGITADEPGRRLQVPATGDELARLGETLNDMLARLEQAIERERRFVDDASHELRTPLGVLRTELELALRKARTAEELEAALRSAAEESDRLNSLAEDLLVLARSDRGRLPVHREDTDVVDLARTVAERFRVAADARGVGVTVDGPQPIRADVDPARVAQALGNMIDNALHHAPRDGSVGVRVTSRDSKLQLEVTDNGPGFPEAFLERAFEPFTRADADRGRKGGGGGAGLGLAIVKAVAESHGGVARVSNSEAGGAVVAIEFPLAAPDD